MGKEWHRHSGGSVNSFSVSAAEIESRYQVWREWLVIALSSECAFESGFEKEYQCSHPLNAELIRWGS